MTASRYTTIAFVIVAFDQRAIASIGAWASISSIDFHRDNDVLDGRASRCKPGADLVSHRDAESVAVVREYSWAFMSADYTPATILCLPWKGWTVNSARPTWPVDPLTADQRDQWRTKGAVTTQETRLFIFLPSFLRMKSLSNGISSSSSISDRLNNRF